ncbi:hypothetical protein [Parazoarcus communis]|uniref:Uncharacterized protein n=1 Tax=Parazoarcus communis SWub3 = DSM 12120 TaxID=1121029 RepID=A0A323URJ9_9RHOO|nr:hypothetical protein [Parazoarcus communis]NMG72894.1 hypothetical protein [Parazoarcus communis SWub3 = DSM 12120]PZA14280.1 hypothetical protein DNK49_22715 [Azoarcus communis] [Parazoarcus communis SWub3 = DSM 12120]
MIPIKNFETDAGQCKYDGCAEIACAQHPRTVISEALPGRFGVPTDKCPYILSQIADDKLDVVFRYWMKQTFIEKKLLPTPAELRELLQRKGVQDAVPVSTVEAVLDGFEWPAYVLDERSKKALSDFGRQLAEHGAGAEQIRFARWHGEMHNAKVRGCAHLRSSA